MLGDARKLAENGIKGRMGSVAFFVVGIFGLAMILSWRAWTVHEYVRTSPDYCARCHEEEAGARRPTGHEDLPCQNCHKIPDEDLFNVYVGVYHSGATMPTHAKVLPEACDSCHHLDEIGQLAMRSPGHTIHTAETSSAVCADCHSKNAHGGEHGPERACDECHAEVPILSKRVGRHDCVNCHTFKGRPSASPLTQVIDATASDGSFTVDDTIVHGAADCGSCHSPHTEGGTAKVVCTRCHRGPIAASVLHLPESHQKCRSCHKAHQPRGDLEYLCQLCHERPRVGGSMKVANAALTTDEWIDPEAASASVGEGAPPDGAETAPIEVETRVPLTEIPHQGKCANCHDPHSFVGEWTAGCENCHDEQTSDLSHLKADSHTRCIGCHEPHSRKPSSDVCRRCHQNQAKGSGGAPSKHRDCLSCHRAHQGRPRFGATCQTCHGEIARGAGAGASKHRQCEKCHTPHGAPAAKSAAACRTCHDQQFRGVASARPEKHRNCRSCHKGHVFSGTAAHGECARCHAPLVAKSASHSGACTTCHGAHGQAFGKARACHGCHAEIRPAVPEHRAKCQGCHRPHLKAKTATQTCATCHETQVRAAKSWPGGSAHSGPCAGCHKTHAERTRPTCASCHPKQGNRAHTGSKHGACKNCHRPHSSPPGGADGWWSRCRDCHEPQARTVSARKKMHSRCQNCHDRPGRVAPGCRSCHQEVVTQLLHTNPRHAPCSRCHGAHAARRPQKAQCKQCHTDRQEHYPEATECQSCHPFTGTGAN